MSEEAIRLVQRVQAALSAENVAAAISDDATVDELNATLAELVEPGFETEMIGSEYSSGSRTLKLHGLDGFREAWQDWTGPYKSFRIEVKEMLDAGEQVVSLVELIGITATGEVEVRTEAAAVWTVRDGRLHRVEFHLDPERALGSAGLRKPAAE